VGKIRRGKMGKKMKSLCKWVINISFLIFLIGVDVYSQSPIQKNGNETFYTYGSYRIDGTEIYLSPDGNAGSAGYYFIINQRPISAQICFNYYDDGLIDDSRVIRASSDNTNWREIGRLPKNSQSQCFDLAPNSDFSNNGSLYIDVYAAPNASLHLRRLTLTYTLNSPPNTPTFYIAPPTGNTNTPVSFSVRTSDPNNDRIRYKWDWDGNGSVDETSDYYASDTNVTFMHTWNTPGIYTVRVKAQDERGAESNWASTQIEIVTYYSISGYVKDGNNNPIRDVGIQVSDNGNIYMRSTDANGYYSVENIRSGHNIIITPQKTGCSFTPANKTYNNISSNQSNQNFTANCNRSPIIGTLNGPTQLNAGQVGNFTIFATDADGDQVKYKWDWNGDGVVDEDNNVYYNSGDIRSFSHSWNTSGTYQVKVKAQDSKGAESSWSNSLSVTVNSVQYYISGRVTDTNNNPMRGIQIELRQNTLEGSLIGTTVTDSNGNYSFTNLNPGTYYFRPTTPNYNYSPTYWSCTLNTSGRYCTGDFIVTPQLSSISGYVRDSLNNGVSDVQIRYYRNGVYIGTYWSTNSQGYYSIDNLANGTYKIEPVKDGVSFNPAFHDNIVVPPSQTNINFTVFTNRSPVINTFNGPAQLNAGQVGNFTISATDADGDQVKYKWDWNGDGIVDEESNYYNSGNTISFSHSWNTAGTYQVKVKAQDSRGAESNWSNILIVNVGDIPYYSISGYVRDSNNNPINNVRIQVSDNGNISAMRTYTNAEGYYLVGNISAGHNIIITPQRTGCSFNPINRTYNNISSNQSNQNFTGKCDIPPIPINNPISPNPQKEIILTNPPDGSVIYNMPIIFQWQPLEGVRQYRITISEKQSTQDTGQGIFFQTSTNDNIFRYDSTQNQTDYRKCLSNGKYWWKVEGLDANGSIIASSKDWYKLRTQLALLFQPQLKPQLMCEIEKELDRYRTAIKCHFSYPENVENKGGKVYLISKDPYRTSQMVWENGKYWGSLITDLTFNEEVVLYATIMSPAQPSIDTQEASIKISMDKKDLCGIIKFLEEGNWGCDRYDQMTNLKEFTKIMDSYVSSVVLSPRSKITETAITCFGAKKIYYCTKDIEELRKKAEEIIKWMEENCVSCKDKLVNELFNPVNLTITLGEGVIMIAASETPPLALMIGSIALDKFIDAVERCGCDSNNNCKLAMGMIKIFKKSYDTLKGIKDYNEKVKVLSERLKSLKEISDPETVARMLIRGNLVVKGGKLGFHIQDTLINISSPTPIEIPKDEDFSYISPLDCKEPEINPDERYEGAPALGIMLNCTANVSLSDIKSNLQINNITRRRYVIENFLNKSIPTEENRIENPAHINEKVSFVWKIPYNKKGLLGFIGAYQLSRIIEYRIDITYQRIPGPKFSGEKEILALREDMFQLSINTESKGYSNYLHYTLNINNPYGVKIPLYIGLCKEGECEYGKEILYEEDPYLHYLHYYTIGKHKDVTQTDTDYLDLPSFFMSDREAKVCIWDGITEERILCQRIQGQ
jgi:protocatechuate 3,4-dioxygenase beta subunit